MKFGQKTKITILTFELSFKSFKVDLGKQPSWEKNWSIFFNFGVPIRPSQYWSKLSHILPFTIILHEESEKKDLPSPKIPLWVDFTDNHSQNYYLREL